MSSSGDKIRCRRVQDGAEVGTPMDTGDAIYNIAVSQDGKWAVSGTANGLVTVWNAETYERVIEFTRHEQPPRSVDMPVSRSGKASWGKLLAGTS